MGFQYTNFAESTVMRFAQAKRKLILKLEKNSQNQSTSYKVRPHRNWKANRELFFSSFFLFLLPEIPTVIHANYTKDSPGSQSIFENNSHPAKHKTGRRGFRPVLGMDLITLSATAQWFPAEWAVLCARHRLPGKWHGQWQARVC